MKNTTSNLFLSISSVVIFSLLLLAIAGGAYKTLNPDGVIVHWLVRTWDSSPFTIFAIGGAALLFKRWLESLQGAKAGDMVFLAALIMGLYFGFNLIT